MGGDNEKICINLAFWLSFDLHISQATASDFDVIKKGHCKPSGTGCS